jgi:hypothetical protein
MSSEKGTSERVRIGMRFGHLTVIGTTWVNTKPHQRWRCICDCGKEKISKTNALWSGHNKSCGCRAHTIHGKSYHPLYPTWRNMIRRCLNPKDIGYKNYGGRGITVCKRWLDVRKFISDMGDKPNPKYTIERINNNKGYYPGNCKWATWKEQYKNRRKHKYMRAA